MDEIILGAYATEAEALEAKAQRSEPQDELTVVNDNVDLQHPYRIKWMRSV